MASSVVDRRAPRSLPLQSNPIQSNPSQLSPRPRPRPRPTPLPTPTPALEILALSHRANRHPRSLLTLVLALALALARALPLAINLPFFLSILFPLSLGLPTEQISPAPKAKLLRRTRTRKKSITDRDWRHNRRRLDLPKRIRSTTRGDSLPRVPTFGTLLLTSIAQPNSRQDPSRHN